MTQQNILEAAKQGNPQAITALMNRSLRPQGVTAKVKLTGDCFHVMLEGETTPDQAAIVPYVTNGIKGLGIKAAKHLAVYGRVTGEDLPAWSDRVELIETVAEPAAKPAVKKVEVVAPASAKTNESAIKQNQLASRVGLGAALLLAVMFFGIITRQTEALKTTQDSLDSLSTGSPTLSTGSEEVTMSKYDQLETGMTYAQAESILGKSGEEMSKNELGGTSTVMYMWQNPGGSNMNAMFQDDALVQKAQFGLQ